MNTRQEPKLPTNQQIRDWTSNVPHARSPEGRLVFPPELVAPQPLHQQCAIRSNGIDDEQRQALRTWAASGRIRLSQREKIRELLARMEIPLLSPQQQHALAMTIKSLRRRYKVVRLGCTTRVEVVILTDPLMLSNVLRPSQEPISIGQWWISLWCTALEIRVICKPFLCPATWFMREARHDISYHPHVHEVPKSEYPFCWGSLCLGDAKPDVTKWAQALDYERAFIKIVEQLSNYNRRGHYYPLENYLAAKCPDCWCDMEGDYCTTCTQPCPTCNKRVYRSLFIRCNGCEVLELSCIHCSRGKMRCPVCGTATCEDCKRILDRECANCEKSVTAHLGGTYEYRENESESVPVSVESPNVLVSPTERPRSERDGSSVENRPF